MAEATGSDRSVVDDGRLDTERDVASIAGAVAQAVPGVHALGSPSGRALARAAGRVPGARLERGPGVRAQVGRSQVAIDIRLSVEYGTAIAALGRQVRAEVSRAVQAETELDVVEVTVNVLDVHHPDDDVARTEVDDDPVTEAAMTDQPPTEDAASPTPAR